MFKAFGSLGALSCFQLTALRVSKIYTGSGVQHYFKSIQRVNFLMKIAMPLECLRNGTKNEETLQKKLQDSSWFPACFGVVEGCKR